MSGEESLAQVNREIAHPKLKNLEKAGFVIFIYSLLFTSLVSFFAAWIIPDEPRQKFLDNLIGGLAMYLVGPVSVRLLFHAFVVLVGTLILAGAVNTAIIGSNGVLNRVAEDVESADASGVSGTPTFFINGRRHYGAYDVATLSAAVRAARVRAAVAANPD